MNNRLAKSGFLLLCAAFLGAAAPAPQRAIEYSQEIEPYVSFLQQQKQNPVDYIMGLFEEHDIVVLCERDHRETTQYDLIFDLVSDPRFIARVGNMFTEVGTSSLRGEVHEFLFSENLTEREIESKALSIYRNIGFHPIWEKHNSFDFLKRLYCLNDSLSAEKKVNLYFSDVPFSWEGMTEEEYKEFVSTLPKRDRTMAKQIIDTFNEILQSGDKRKKALVIMNSAHAFNDRFTFVRTWFEVKGDTVGRHLFEAYPGKVANVMINFLARKGMSDRKFTMKMIQNGKWDAAFEVVGNRGLGFDFAGSPFGNDSFDYIPSVARGLTYQDMFTGFVFYRPVEELRLAIGVPGLTDEGYGKVILERFRISGSPLRGDDATSFVSNFSSATGRVQVFTYMDKGVFGDPDRALDLTEKDSWLRRPKGHRPIVSQENDGRREKCEK